MTNEVTSVFPHDKLMRIKRSLERQGHHIEIGTQDKYLDAVGARASTMPLGAGRCSILFRKNPTRSEVIEELIHVGQERTERFGVMGTGYSGIQREIEAKEYLIRNRKRLGIPNVETRELICLLRQHREELRELEGN